MAGRTWLAVILCCFIWFAYLKWFAPVPPQTTPSSSGSNTSNSSSVSDSPAPAQSTLPSWYKSIPPTLSKAVDTDAQQVIFSDLGGKIARVAVKNYRETIDKNSPYVTPISPEKSTLSLATLFTDVALLPFADGQYQRADSYNAATYTLALQGIQLTKSYRLAVGSHFIDAMYQFSFPTAAKRDLGYLLIPVGSKASEFSVDDPLKHWEIVVYQDDAIQRKTIDQLKEPETLLQGNTGWLSYGNRYFATVIVNKSPLNPDVVLVKNNDFTGAMLRYPIRTKEGDKELKIDLRFLVGPKNYAELSQVPGLRGLIDYGMFSWLAFPMLEILRFFYRFVHNYGVAIILLTVLVRALFYPLSLKGYKSMKAMQKLQPQLLALKEKYKSDPQRFNQEQVALFKTHKVNPMGGCLPMLVQLPVFIALYALLANSIELFHAPFFGWVKDLSAKDPYYVYPILMGIAMFVQQKMTPTAGLDPMQAKMMLIMPVIFTFFMVNLPSGLTLYIFVSTLLGILQQVAMNRDGSTAASKLVAAPGPSSGK